MSDHFIRWAESCYGKYTDGMRVEVARWLEGRPASMLAALQEVILRDHPYVYKTPPGVHELEAFRVEAQARGHKLDESREQAKGRTMITDYVVTKDEADVIAEAIAKLRAKFYERGTA